MCIRQSIPVVKKKRINIYEMWLEAEHEAGKTQVQAIADFNEATGLSIDKPRLHRCRRGKSVLGGGAGYNYMMQIVIPYWSEGILATDQQQKLIEVLRYPDPAPSPSKNKKKRRSVKKRS